MRLTKTSHFETLFIFFGCLFLFLFGLNRSEIIDFDSRFYLFALEMWRHGLHWFPTTYLKPYPDYPVTSTFLIYISALLWGGLNKCIAVLPSAIVASLTVLLTYHIGALHDRYWGRCAATFLLLTLAFFQNARSIALDIYPTFITVSCFYLINSKLGSNIPQNEPTSRRKIKSTSSHANQDFIIYMALVCLFVLGFAFRGPIGLVIPTGVVCVCYFMDTKTQSRNFWSSLPQKLKAIFLIGTLSLMALIVLMIILLALAQHFYGVDFMSAVLHMEVLGRINTRPVPFYFYWVQGFTHYAMSFPIACLVLGGVIYLLWTKKIARTPEVNMLLKLTAWVLIIILGMSIPDEKKPRYILPISPAIALIAAYLFVIPSNEKYWVFLRSLIIKLFLFFPTLLMMMVAAFIFYAKHHQIEITLPYVHLFLACIIVQVFYLLLMPIKYLSAGLLISSVLLFSGFYIFIVEPIQLTFNRTHDFVVEVEAKRLAEHAKLAFYKEGPDGLPIKYLINMPREEQPLFVEQISQLDTQSYPLIIITSANHFKQLTKEELKHFELIQKGKIGHTEVIIFRPIYS